MENIRIGNDITVKWSIMNADGKPYCLKGKNLKLFLITPVSNEEIKDYTISVNTITWTFYGKDQKHFGVYALTLVENDKNIGMVTVDAIDAFKIISYANTTISTQAKSVVKQHNVKLLSTVDIVHVKPIIPMIGKNGTWIINGEDTGFPAKGPKGDVSFPTFRVNDQMQLVMTPITETDKDRFKLENGKLIMLI